MQSMRVMDHRGIVELCHQMRRRFGDTKHGGDLVTLNGKIELCHQKRHSGREGSIMGVVMYKNI
jgi:hypothetical protein